MVKMQRTVVAGREVVLWHQNGTKPTWGHLQLAIMDLPKHRALKIPKDVVDEPLENGFYKSTGLDRKARRHLRRVLPDKRGLHVLDYGDYYLAHWDRIDPSVSVLLHFVHDVSVATVRGFSTLAGRLRGRTQPVAPVLFAVSL